jgi:hypothetical protein
MGEKRLVVSVGGGVGVGGLLLGQESLLLLRSQ